MEPVDINALKRHFTSLNCELVDTIASTQSAVKLGGLLIAEEQTAGVGRRGNHWLTPKGRSICLSYKFLSCRQPSQLTGFQMVVALATMATIKHFEPNTDVQLKWPNDLYTGGKKFAGILIYLTPKNTVGTEINTGIGINWALSESQLKSVNQPVSNIPIQQKPSRTAFIIELIEQIDSHHEQFVNLGLDALYSDWQNHDLLTDRDIELDFGDRTIQGRYGGISPRGELILVTSDGIKQFSSGEVSLRLTQ